MPNNVVRDYGSGNNDGTIINLNPNSAYSSRIPNIIGSGLSITLDGVNGNSGHISIGDNLNEIITGTLATFSYSLWFKCTGVHGAGTQILLSKYHTPSDRQFYLGVTSGNIATLIFDDPTDFGSAMTMSEPHYGFSGWTHVGASFDIAGDNYGLYVSGKLGDTGDTLTDIEEATGYLVIGALSLGASAFSGEIADVRMYDRALSSGEMYALATYDTSHTGWPSDQPAGHWITNYINLSVNADMQSKQEVHLTRPAFGRGD